MLIDRMRIASPLTPPRIMGILNCTPDSFSDGGRYLAIEAALTQGLLMCTQGADVLDIGGESLAPAHCRLPQKNRNGACSMSFACCVPCSAADVNEH
ncbi:dihydropteroate synthase [Chromatium okenii]|uniref:dihydropteroate synthase n=1 Tax=Chromatium okenii TaxID=61644 RepID=UPI002413AFD3|nr:dihydropteroate synthase [Chromatium okenii]